jgi:hypothetical protein
MEPEMQDYQRIRIPVRNRIIGFVIVVLYFQIDHRRACVCSGRTDARSMRQLFLAQRCVYVASCRGVCATLMRYWLHQHNFDHDDECW